MAGVVVIGTRLIHGNHHRRQTLKPKSLSSLILLSHHHHQFIKFPSFGPPSTTMSASAVTPTTNPPLVQDNPTTPKGCWSEFANNVSGEWDGFGADFSVDGNPIELPENVVPNAYREWEVKVFDWQTQCPTLAQPNNLTLIYKLIKLLPTVGCEADAATRYTIDERIIGGVDNMVSSFAYHTKGSYTAVWESTNTTTSSSSSSFMRVLELEHCLINPRDKESRIRIVQIVGVEDNQKHKKLVLKNIKVFVEQWYGPFRNGEQLGGCAIRDSAFASTQALSGSQVSGAWEVSNSVATFQDSPNTILQQLVTVDGIHKEVRDQQNLVLLPKNLWSSIQYNGEQTFCQVGWLLEPGRAITSKCIFSENAELKEIVTSSETATPGPPAPGL